MRKSFWLASILALGHMIGAGAATAQSAADLCNRGSIDEVIVGCSSAIKQNPKGRNISIAYHNRGSAWIGKGDYDKAIADFDEAIRLNPKLAPAYGSRGMAWGMKGNYDKAIADWNEAIRLDPKDAVAYRNRGTGWNYKGGYDKAIADWTESIRLNPKDSMNYSNRGSAWTNKGDYDKAIADLNEAIRLDSKNGIAYSNRGLAWTRQGDYDKAIVDLTESIRLNPKNPISFGNRGSAWIRKGDYDKAIADFDEAIRLSPKFAVLYNLRGTAWNRKDDLDKAIADYRQAIQLDPNYAVARENLQLASDKKQRVDLRDSSAAATATPSEVATPPSESLARGKRVALVIGNSKYINVPVLENPTRDAELFAQTLRDVGFDDVATKLNLSRAEMMAALKEFEKAARTAEWAAIYFAGHGMEVSGVNYMVPIDAQMVDESSISNQTVNLEYLLNAVEVSKKLRLVILDACRNNPYAKQLGVAAARGVAGVGSSAVGKGLGRIEPEPGTLVVYSAKAGEFALDGNGKNSPFAEALVKRIEQKPAIEVRRLFDFVREDVVEATRKQQQPFAYGSLSAKDDFFFLR